MRKRHQRILEKVLAHPPPSNLRWREVESMLLACGVEIVERSGSHIGLTLAARRMVVHRPHPGPTAGRATIRDLAAFLRSAGVQP